MIYFKHSKQDKHTFVWFVLTKILCYCQYIVYNAEIISKSIMVEYLHASKYSLYLHP